jgi:hypothetical protein
MAVPRFTPDEFRQYIKFSTKKHILVEGSGDKYSIDCLWKGFTSQANQLTIREQISVDSAQSLVQLESGTGNNCEKVKEVSRSICNKSYANRFVGFVDRELNNFNWDYELSHALQDNMNCHAVEERLVFSRGHSIENYIFELDILNDYFCVLSTSPYTRQALHIFNSLFPSALCIACTISLAASKVRVLKKIESTIDWELIHISSDNISFLLDDWIDKLVNRQMELNQRESLKEAYNIYYQYVINSSLSIVRWMCHGHIGYEFLRALYERCLVAACPNNQDREKERGEISWVKKEKMFSILINCWIKRVLDNNCEYPREIFELLGVNFSGSL